WCRYADDGLVHCRSEREAEALRGELQERLAECHLELHPTKTKIVDCKDGKRKATYPNVKFDFLGYCFRPRWVKRMRDNTMFCGFNPAVSPAALKTMRSTFGRLFAGGLAPFLMEPHTGSPTIFFGTILAVVAIGAFIPLVFGRETVGQLETVTEAVSAL